MEGVLAGRKAVAISFPFFSGFNNWTSEEVTDAVRVRACASLFAASATHDAYYAIHAGMLDHLHVVCMLFSCRTITVCRWKYQVWV